MALINLEVQAQVNDAIRAMGRMNAQFDIMGKVNQDAAGALGVFGVSLTALNNPLTLVAEGMKASIDKSIEWGNTIDDVQKITGQSAEETSKLVTVLGDFGIEANTLKGAAKALKEQGLTPNLETLKDLAKQYQSIQDPAARTAWGTKTLGKAFFDLSEVLTKTPEEFAAVEQAALTSGKVIGQDFVDDIEAAQIKAKQLQDRVDGLMLKLGPVLIDTVSGAADSFSMLTTIWATANVKGQQLYGIIDEQQAQLRLEAIAAGDTAAVFKEQYDPAILATVDAHDRLHESSVIATDSVSTLGASAERWAGLAAKIEADKLAADILSLKDATAEYSVITGQAVDNELKSYQDKQRDIGGQIADTKTKLELLGKTPHLTPEQKLEMKELSEQLDKEKKQYEDNAEAHNLASRKIILGYLEQKLAVDGLSDEERSYLLDVGEQWGVYGEGTKKVWDGVVAHIKEGALDADATVRDMGSRFPSYFSDINFNITGHYQTTGNAPFGAEPGGEAPVNYGTGDNGNTNYGGAQAAGGDYMVTRPTWFLAGEAGAERATFTPQGKAGPGGGLYIGAVNITAAPGQDAESLWKQIRVIAARDARAMSQAGVRV